MEHVGKRSLANLALLKIPSAEDVLIGRMFIAEGEGPHATVVILHGFPGVMMNLDIASELHQKGWNVLVINYRGAWGSKGDFSYTHALEDVHAAVHYIKQHEVAEKNRIDIDRIALIGHSFGGFLALKAASLELSIQAVASISGTNLGLYIQMIEQNPASQTVIYEMIKESLFFLNGCTPEVIMEEVYKHRDDWNSFIFAPTLADRKILLTAASYDEETPREYFHDPLVKILEGSDAKHLQTKIFETDHNYTNVRKELAITLHEWLTENL